jgi:phenylacetate-CoA ligase
MQGLGLSIIDTARGAYVRSPYFLRRSLAPLISLVPTRLKFGSGYRQWRQRIARAANDPVYASEQQLIALRALLAKAHAGSGFYRPLIESAFGPNFDPERIQLADIQRMPVLGKTELREAGEAALAVPSWQVDAAETSGSNAEKPFGFFLDKDRSAREMAFVYSVWARTGYTEGDARASLRGIGVGPGASRIHHWDPALRELQLSAFPLTRQDAKTYLDLIDQRSIRFLYGYPSSIELFCRHMRALGRSPRRPIRGVLLTSEPVYDHQRRIIRDVLGEVPVASFFGLSEKVVFGAEVEGEPNVYESNPLYGLAELVDDSNTRVTEPGREGRLVGTGFLSTGMPFIRYDTGDRARLIASPNEANGQRLKVQALGPRRKPDYLIGADGARLVTVDLTPEIARYFAGIDEFQFYQDAPGEVLIRYVPAADGGPDDVARLVAYLADRTGGRLRFSTAEVTELVGGRGGKRAFIDQRLVVSLD